MNKDWQELQDNMINATNCKNEGDYSTLVKLLVDINDQ